MSKIMIRNLIKTCLIFNIVATPIYLRAEPTCKPIKKLTFEKRITDKVLAETITQSGNYCLEQDIVTPRVYDFEGERGVGGEVLAIESSNVNINLKQKMIYGEQRGIRVLSTLWKDKNEPFHHIVINDGILKSRTNVGINFAGEYISSGFSSTYEDFLGDGKKQDFWIKFANDAWIAQNKKLAQIRDCFPFTEHRIENVKISAGDLAIAMKGGANVIKNNIIKVTDGSTASIYLFGPNQVIENNIIIFKGKTRSPSAAPIKIHTADDSIIRNNTIIIESSGEDIPQTAISIFDSKNVVIENNQIFGTKSAYKIWDEEDKGSSVKETGTTFPSFWKKPKPSF